MATLDVRRHTIAAGVLAHWDAFNSARREVYPVGQTAGDKQSVLRWESGGLYATTKKAYLRKAFRFVTGSPGRLWNFHSAPADAPDGWNQQGIDGSYVSLVSAVAIDWKEGASYADPAGAQSGMVLVLEPNERGSSRGSPYGNRTHWPILSDAECIAARTSGALITVTMELTWGFPDSVPPGAAKVWVNSENTPRVDVSGVATQWLNQGLQTVWEGGYAYPGFTSQCVIDHVAYQTGRTAAECLADAPTFNQQWTEAATSSNASSTQTGTLDSNTLFAPLAWSSPTTSLPEGNGAWTPAVQWAASSGLARTRHKKLLGV